MAKETFRPVTRIFAGSKELRKYLIIERKASMTSFNNEYRDHKSVQGNHWTPATVVATSALTTESEERFDF